MKDALEKKNYLKTGAIYQIIVHIYNSADSQLCFW